jgi:sugar fermentation stimulation protein A
MSDVLIPFSAPIVRGRFLRRYKRFFVDAELEDGRTVTAHTPNTGAMTGMLREGAPVLLTYDAAPTRKLDYTLQAIDIDGRWAGCHTQTPNRVAEAALLAGAVRELRGFRACEREVRVEAAGEKARLDLALKDHPRGREVLVEVKTVTLKDGNLARFPDAPTERGRKHLHVLRALAEGGQETALVFVCQRLDVGAVGPAYDVDPAYGQALHDARDAGVRVCALQARVSERGIHLEGRLPIRLRTNRVGDSAGA